MAECENVIGESGCIGVVLLNTQVGFVVKQTIQNMSRIPNRHVDDFGVERCVLIGNMGVESNARVAPITCVYFGRGFSAAPSPITLPIRRGGSSLTPSALRKGSGVENSRVRRVPYGRSHLGCARPQATKVWRGLCPDRPPPFSPVRD
jgi:hypothetical protein